MSKFCRECGQEIKEGEKFCSKCGTSAENSSKTKITTAISDEKVISSHRKMTNKLLCKLTVWPWVITLILALLMVFAGDGFGIFLGTLAFIGGSMIIVFGIWGLIRLGKAKRKVATMIVILTVVVVIFQKVELIYDLSIIGLFISTVMGLVELNKLPDNVS